MSESEKSVPISQIDQSGLRELDDWVAVEEPLEIRIVAGPDEKRRSKSLSITMRTPGHDFELAVGFFVSEGIIQNKSQLKHIEFCGRIDEGRTTANTVSVELTPQTKFDIEKLQRHFYTTSSCGVCGKASLEALEYQNLKPIESIARVSPEIINKLPNLLRQQQILFNRTGGIHAAGLFDTLGNLKSIREDVGRHNALDKLVGHHVLCDKFPITDSVLVVSGRASFELLQKSLAASIPIFVAVGAPSSLAIQLAQRFNVTLIGFTSQSRFNIYAGKDRVVE